MQAYTVMLVDDEPWALESLRLALNWEQNNFEVLGCFTDPLVAWEDVQKKVPDVVFIDIRMPEMGGLEMVKKARELGVPTLFVIVSGYGEFKYAQEALRLGVFDYCLKPVDRLDAAKLLDKIAVSLEGQRVRRNAQLCEEILMGCPADQLFFQQKQPIVGDYWQVAVLRFAEDKVQQQIYPALSGLKYLQIRLGSNKLMILFNGDCCIAKLTDAALRKLSGQQLIVGLSSVSSHANHIARRISEAQNCAYHDFINPSVHFVHFNRMENTALLQCVQQLETAIIKRDMSLWEYNLKHLSEICFSENIQMWHLVDVWNKVMTAFDHNSKSLSFNPKLEWIVETDELRVLLQDLPTMCAYLQSLMKQHVSEAPCSKEGTVNESFQELLEYVRQNYTKRIRLNDLADRYHLNMAYCSELFHKVLGMTFTDYLTKLRMEKAIEMIKEGKVNLQQAALELGYGDYFSFSKRFKSYHGVSPSQIPIVKK